VSEGEAAARDASAGLGDAAQRIREAAKYVVAAFGAVGAVLISGVSLKALPSARHPFLAGLMVVVAVAAIAIAIALVIRVITPKQMTLGQLAELQKKHPTNKLVLFLNANQELFEGYGSNLSQFQTTYLRALQERTDAFHDYLDHLRDSERETRSRVTAARVQFLYPVVAKILDVSVFYQLRRRFSRSWPIIAVAAIVVAGAAAVYSWASAAPSREAKPPVVDCVSYFQQLHRLADEVPRFAIRVPRKLPLDSRSRACGFKSRAELASFALYLGKR
jgi:Tfp pilus assembly major pilin PilA